jgi:YfiH family protein
MTLPPVPESFEWTEESWGPGLRCRPLAALAPHVFSTRQLELTAPAGQRALAAAVRARELAMLAQVHGATVVVARRGESGAIREGDALIANDPGVAVAVRAADCVPVLMADRTTGAVAAVHAGWRGTAARAVPAALDALAREFGTRPSDVVAAIGPSIGVCCYEVGPELVDAFAAAGHERYLVDRWFPIRRDVNEGGARPGTLRLDVAGANRDQLVLAGVPEEQVHTAGLCTAMHLDVLTSYRAEKEKAGRIAAAIASGK